MRTGAGTHRHAGSTDGWEIRTSADTVRLRARRPAEVPLRPLIADRPARAHAIAPHLLQPPALDGTLDGFDTSFPLTLDYDDQYRRSEEPYPGTEAFSAVAWAAWSDETVYLAVDVRTDDRRFRSADAPPLRLDNEPEVIHSDGLQIYLRVAAVESRGEPAPVYGFLVVPSADGELRVQGTGGTSGHAALIRGAWARSDTGYRVTLAMALPPDAFPRGDGLRTGDRLDFDLLVNRLSAGRERRDGQLVWSGGGGWIWLRGDRQDPARFGLLELG